MKSNSVVFIAFQERENLGIWYMYAVLSEAGYEVSIIDFKKDKTEILKELSVLDPLMVGFSVIFENHLYEFQELVEYLRNKGIQVLKSQETPPPFQDTDIRSRSRNGRVAYISKYHLR